MSKKYTFITLLALVYIEFFSFIDFKMPFYNSLCRIVDLVLILFLIFKVGFKVQNFIDRTVLGLMLVPFLSIIPAFFIHQQDVERSFLNTTYNAGYIFYFLLCSLKCKESKIRNIILCLGFFYCLINVVQQFTYPNILFNNTDQMQERNGYYNFTIFGTELGIFFVIFYYAKCLSNKKTLLPLLLFAIGILCFYFKSKRQSLFYFAIIFIYGLFILHRIRLKQLVFVLTGVIILYLNFDKLFGQLIEMSDKDDVSYYARIMSYSFYGITYNKGNLLAIIFGNGIPSIGITKYGREINLIQTMTFKTDWGFGGLWRDDIGIVGSYSLYGLVYVFVIVYYFYNYIKNRKYFDVPLRLFTLYIILELPLVTFFNSSNAGILCDSFMFFLFRESYVRNKNSFGIVHSNYIQSPSNRLIMNKQS